MKIKIHSIGGLFALAGISYLVGFWHARHDRPIPFNPPPSVIFDADDVDYSAAFFNYSGPLYLSWDAVNGHAVAYYESSHIIGKVRGRFVLRYSPITGQPLPEVGTEKGGAESATKQKGPGR